MHRKFGNKGLEKIHHENINQKNSHVSNISVNFLLCKIVMIVSLNASPVHNKYSIPVGLKSLTLKQCSKAPIPAKDCSPSYKQTAYPGS